MSLPENPQRPKRDRPLLPADVERVARISAGREDLPGSTILRCCRFVIEYFLGPDWFALFIPPDAKYQGYLTMRPEMATEEVGQDPSHMAKMLNFAEPLLNLQATPGFDSLLDKLLGGDIEPTIAELSAGMAFSLYGHSFEFVVPVGQRLSDFDVSISYSDGTLLAADVKCKLDNSDYAASTIWHAFKRAKSQIKKDTPAMVFVRVPQTWVDRQTGVIGVADEVQSVVTRLFRSERFVLVAFHTIMHLVVPEGMYVRHMALEFENEHAQFSRPGGWKLFAGEPNAPWTSLLPLINQVLGSAQR
ncbi:MAG TPA: hypothetical protein VHY34_01740 [Caulobacteraceae bacterium]|nr:hypothetical protein [Caulobacteraceae bacterium]